MKRFAAALVGALWCTAAAAVSNAPPSTSQTTPTQAPAATTASVKQKIPSGFKNEADFVKQMNQMLPLTPEEIEELRARLDATRAAIHPGPLPKAVSHTVLLDLQPGSPVSKIDVVPGFVSSIVFLDSTGAPWPITSVTVGNPKWFDVTAPKVQPQNLLTVAALGTHLSSNLAVTLKNHPTPILIVLTTDSGISAMLTALRANEQGPNATSPIISAPVSVGADSVLLGFLDRVPPDGAIPLVTDNKQVEAWKYEDTLYVRTQYPAVFPAWSATVSGDAGVRVYAMPLVASVLLTRAGVPFHVRVNVPPWANAKPTSSDQ